MYRCQLFPASSQPPPKIIRSGTWAEVQSPSLVSKPTISSGPACRKPVLPHAKTRTDEKNFTDLAGFPWKPNLVVRQPVGSPTLHLPPGGAVPDAAEVDAGVWTLSAAMLMASARTKAIHPVTPDGLSLGRDTAAIMPGPSLSGPPVRRRDHHRVMRCEGFCGSCWRAGPDFLPE